jgi:tripartite-type tricarboxylate transporter receptor subunit TctC
MSRRTGTPQAIIDRFYRDASRHLLAPGMREKLSAAGAEPAGTSPPELAAFLETESNKWLRVTQQVGLYRSQ